MEAITLGFILAFLIVGVGAMMLISALTGANWGILKTLGLSSGAGILGGIGAVFTDTYAYLSACFTGQLQFYGWIFLAGIGSCLAVWTYNAWQDYSKNRPLSFVD